MEKIFAEQTVVNLYYKTSTRLYSANRTLVNRSYSKSIVCYILSLSSVFRIYFVHWVDLSKLLRRSWHIRWVHIHSFTYCGIFLLKRRAQFLS